MDLPQGQAFDFGLCLSGAVDLVQIHFSVRAFRWGLVLLDLPSRRLGERVLY